MRISTDMRVTTEAEVKTQRVHNAELEKKYVELLQSIQAQFTALRAELGTEFDSTKKDAAEIRALDTGSEEQKRTMIADIEKHFRYFAVKSGEMRELIG